MYLILIPSTFVPETWEWLQNKTKKGPDGSSSCLERLVGFCPHFRLPLERRAGGYGRADHQDRREAGRLFDQLHHEGDSRPYVLWTSMDAVGGWGDCGGETRERRAESRSNEATGVGRGEGLVNIG